MKKPSSGGYPGAVIVAEPMSHLRLASGDPVGQCARSAAPIWTLFYRTSSDYFYSLSSYYSYLIHLRLYRRLVFPFFCVYIVLFKLSGKKYAVVDFNNDEVSCRVSDFLIIFTGDTGSWVVMYGSIEEKVVIFTSLIYIIMLPYIYI